MKFACNHCCSSYELTPEAIHRYNEIANETGRSQIDQNLSDERMYRLGIDPIYIQVLEEIPNAGPHCTPQVFEIADDIVAKSGTDLATAEYPGWDLFVLLSEELSTFEIITSGEPIKEMPELPPLIGTPTILTPDETSSYRPRVRFVLTT